MVNDKMVNEYVVSALKYRPLNFDSVVGQRSLTTTLKNSISSGKLAHAYLFCGPRGVGKTTCARIFAKAINCFNPQDGGEPCGQCESCQAFDQQRSLNIHELDAASTCSPVQLSMRSSRPLKSRHPTSSLSCALQKSTKSCQRF